MPGDFESLGDYSALERVGVLGTLQARAATFTSQASRREEEVPEPRSRPLLGWGGGEGVKQRSHLAQRERKELIGEWFEFDKRGPCTSDVMTSCNYGKCTSTYYLQNTACKLGFHR